MFITSSLKYSPSCRLNNYHKSSPSRQAPVHPLIQLQQLQEHTQQVVSNYNDYYHKMQMQAIQLAPYLPQPIQDFITHDPTTQWYGYNQLHGISAPPIITEHYGVAAAAIEQVQSVATVLPACPKPRYRKG